VRYRRDGRVATITMDDGRVNALSPAMLAELDRALDRAHADATVVVLSGRGGVFCAGFDLGVLKAGGEPAADMVRSGFMIAARLLAFPTPVVVACTGHAFAMGAFLLLASDYRVGTLGAYTLVANEVAIGLTMPHAAIAILRQRLTPAAFERATLLAEPFDPPSAVAAGFLDQTVEPAAVAGTAQDVAHRLAGLDPVAHAATKARARANTIDALRQAIATDAAEMRARTS